MGPPLADELVRAMLALRARTLAQGYSGVRTEIVARLLEMLDHDLLPVVPSQGSVGASGDLAPFAHLALPIIGEGFLKIDGQAVPAADGLQAAKPVAAPAPAEGRPVPSQRDRGHAGDGGARTRPGAAIWPARPTSPAAYRSKPCWVRPDHSGRTSTPFVLTPVRSNPPDESPA